MNVSNSNNSVTYKWTVDIEQYAWRYSDNFFIKSLHSPFRIAIKYSATSEQILIKVLKYTTRPGNATITIYINCIRKEIYSITNWKHTWDISYDKNWVGTCASIQLHLKMTWHDMIINAVNDIDNTHTKDLLMSEKFSDVTIVIDNEEISAHKYVLIYHSPIFLAMLNSNMTENETGRIEIKNLDLDVMKEVLSFMYTGELITKENRDVLLQVLVVADMYQVNALIKFCEDELYKYLTLNYVMYIFKFASLYNLKNLRKDSIDFMIHHYKTIVEMDDFKKLCTEHPHIFHEVFVAIGEDDSHPGLVIVD